MIVDPKLEGLGFDEDEPGRNISLGSKDPRLTFLFLI